MDTKNGGGVWRWGGGYPKRQKTPGGEWGPKVVPFPDPHQGSEEVTGSSETPS